MTKSPNAMRDPKEAIRAVRRMGVNEADDYLTVKNQACKMTDKIPGRDEGMRQFLDEKSYRPGLGQLDLKKAARRKASSAATPTTRVRAKKMAKKKK
jgi:trans-feruloyl-CoA hydratase/vanillin synthase